MNALKTKNGYFERYMNEKFESVKHQAENINKEMNDQFERVYNRFDRAEAQLRLLSNRTGKNEEYIHELKTTRRVLVWVWGVLGTIIGASVTVLMFLSDIFRR